MGVFIKSEGRWMRKLILPEGETTPLVWPLNSELMDSRPGTFVECTKSGDFLGGKKLKDAKDPERLNPYGDEDDYIGQKPVDISVVKRAIKMMKDSGDLTYFAKDKVTPLATKLTSLCQFEVSAELRDQALAEMSEEANVNVG